MHPAVHPSVADHLGGSDRDAACALHSRLGVGTTYFRRGRSVDKDGSTAVHFDP